VSFTSRPLYPGECALGTHWIGKWVRPRACLVAGNRTPAIQTAARRYTDSAFPTPIFTLQITVVVSNF
jgi:hypothetical protein